jgi:hypothetical protein
MSNCIYCEEKLSERGAFCQACGKQSKCTSCNEQLEPGGSFCVACGAKCGDSSTDSSQQGRAVNTFEFTETKTGRSAKAVLTDESVANLQDTLSLVVSSYPLGSIPRQPPRLPHASNGQQDLFASENGTGSSEDAIDISHKSLSSTGNKTQNEIKSLFFLDGEKLVLEVQDLKASGIKDFGIRLAYLRMLYAKEVDGLEFLSRDDLNATIKEVMGTLDPNVGNWISTTNDFSIKEDAGKFVIRLRGDGQKKALETLVEVLDPDKVGAYLFEKKGKSASKSSSKSDTSNGTTKASSGSGKPKNVESWIKSWEELKLDVDLQNTAKSAGQLDRCLLAVALIHRVTNGGTDAATTRQMAGLLTDLFFVSVSRQNLDRVLKDGGHKDMLIKTSKGYRITPEGIKKAAGLLGDKFSGGKK